MNYKSIYYKDDEYEDTIELMNKYLEKEISDLKNKKLSIDNNMEKEKKIMNLTISNKSKKKSFEDKEKLRQYNREYYNKIRKNKSRNINKSNIYKKTNIINHLTIPDFTIKIEYGKFILEF